MEEQRRSDNLEYRKEQNHAYARRMITAIAIVLTVLAIVLVTVSLLLGSRIDQIG
uniref:Serine protease n=1 Tax=Loa loa TaxID=7209 RepID=A0A1I7V881_LOALO